MERRVVITGLGAITPIGNTSKEMWDSIKTGKSGIDEITLINTETFKTKLAAEVKSYDPQKYFEVKAAKRLDRDSQFAMIAAREALEDSKLNRDNADFNNIGIYISSGIGGFNTIETQCNTCNEKGNSRVSPMFIPMGICNMPAGNVAIDLGLKGSSLAIVTACASSTHSIGEAYRTIKHGYEDIIFAGGVEAAITPTAIAGFENMKALSNATDKTRASIPFDKERTGFVMGEGAGVVVLEELEHAKKRGAKIYAEVIGYGATSDAYHITSPEPDGEGATRAVIRALKDAGIDSTEVDYINAHGTSTHLNDSIETKVVNNVFGDNSKVRVSSTKGNTGHLLGAAGAVEAIISVKAIEEGILPATINYKEKDEECDLNLVVNQCEKQNINIAMSNSLGFGGHNASIIFKKFEG